AIDTGGTFTDCVWVEGGALKTLKVFSTPDDPSRAIAEALKTISRTIRKPGAGVALTLLHGTTVGTNALLQRKGARVALITTSGFEDVIEIGRQARPRPYDFFFDRVAPLVRRELRFGVKERTDAEGRVLERPPEAELARLREEVRRATKVTKSARRGAGASRGSSSCNRAAGSRRWSRRRGNRCARCYRAQPADWWARRLWPAAAGSGRFSPSTWEGPRPMWRQCRARFEPAANRKWPGFRWEFPCWRSTP